MEIAIFWLLLAAGLGLLANARGRNGFGWFLLAALLSPLIAIIFLLVLPKLGDAAAPRSPSGDVISERTHTRCPSCRELVRRDASKCRFCGAELVPQTVAPGPPAKAPASGLRQLAIGIGLLIAVYVSARLFLGV